jgi:hypothetical protein
MMAMELTGVSDQFCTYSCDRCGTRAAGARHGPRPVCDCKPSPTPAEWREIAERLAEALHEFAHAPVTMAAKHYVEIQVGDTDQAEALDALRQYKSAKGE